MIINQDFLPDCPARPKLPLREVTSITIHWIGPYPNQTVYEPRTWWIKSNQPASAHYIIKDKKILQTIPIDEVSWHCGAVGNYTSVSIECIPQSVKGIFGADTIETLKYLLSTLPKVPLKRHFDWSGKDCPLYYTPFTPEGDDNWRALVANLQEE
jgi:N-acetylmuramoyl-L-alanine amidase